MSLDAYAEALERERQKWDAVYKWLPCLFRCVLTAMALEVATRKAWAKANTYYAGF